MEGGDEYSDERKTRPIGSRFCILFENVGVLELDLKVDSFLHASCTDFYTRTIRNTSPLEIWVYTTVT
jgi:hypothetical protein